jgi:hypothetical protein
MPFLSKDKLYHNDKFWRGGGSDKINTRFVQKEKSELSVNA